MKNVVGFAARKRNGKGVLSDILVMDYGYKKIAVADYLKKICCRILACSLESLNRWKDNGTVFDDTPNLHWMSMVVSQETGIDVNNVEHELKGVEIVTVRTMLQVIGTDVIRKFYPNWHSDCLRREIENIIADGGKVVVEDVRFPNEKAVIEECGGEVFFVVRPTFMDVSNHISETSLEWRMFPDDHIIYNMYPLEVFEELFVEHCRNDFKNSTDIRKFLLESEYHWKLGLNDDRTLEELRKYIPELKNDTFFMQNGVIVGLNNEIGRKTFNTPLFNPLLTEDLKKYL